MTDQTPQASTPSRCGPLEHDWSERLSPYCHRCAQTMRTELELQVYAANTLPRLRGAAYHERPSSDTQDVPPEIRQHSWWQEFRAQNDQAFAGLREQLEAAQQRLYAPDCQCDPPGSGEEFCNRACEVKAAEARAAEREEAHERQAGVWAKEMATLAAQKVAAEARAEQMRAALEQLAERCNCASWERKAHLVGCPALIASNALGTLPRIPGVDYGLASTPKER